VWWDNYIVDKHHYIPYRSAVEVDYENIIGEVEVFIIAWYEKSNFLVIAIEELEAGHSIKCITHASHSIAFNMFLHFMTL